MGTVFGIGGTSVISRALGEGRKNYAKKVCSFCMWSCVAVGVLMSALFLIFMDQILALIGASAETWDYARTYLTIVSCSGPFVLIANCYSNVIRAEGQSGKAMMGQLFQHYTMELGQFDNMIIRDNWCAIRYTVKIKNLHTGEEILQNTMEFVMFRENPDPVGVRVVEGWALSDSPLSAKGQ